MPTPIPIMAANAGVNELIASTRAASKISRSPVARLNSAVTMGRPIATAEPNAIKRMTAPAASPTNSARPGGTISPDWTTAPPTSSWSSGVDRSSTKSNNASSVESGSSMPRPEYCSVAYAIAPSREIDPAPGAYGETMTATSGSCAACARRSSTRARTASSLKPAGACITRSAGSPACCGNRSSSRSRAA